MSVPFSRPVVPPQPDAPSYSVHELALFQTYTRERYRADFGSQAPPYDPSRPVKSWFDSTVDTAQAGTTLIYRVIRPGANNQWGVQQMALTAQEAAAVNLTGRVEYAPYVLEPSDARRGGSPINPIYLSLESDARRLMTELGGSDLGDEGISAVFPAVYPANDPRRLWYFLFHGRAVNVGALVYNRNKKGIGSPGRWDVSTGEPVWIADPEGPSGLDDTRPPRDMPVRDLLPNERLETGPMGVRVVRTDLEQRIEEQAGRFTAQDRALLEAIHRMVTKLTG